MKFFKRLKIPKIKVRLPSLSVTAVRELFLVAGYAMVVTGIYGYDWRAACIIGGLMLMKFSGLVWVAK